MSRQAAPLLASRRALLAAAPALALLASGCGFQLRRAATYSFQSIAVKGKGLLQAIIRRELKGQGTVSVLAEGADAQGAEVVLEVLETSRNSGIAASTSGGQIRELTLTLSVRFQLTRTQGGAVLIAPATVQQTRDISYNETSALAKENEQELLYRDMTVDIAQQIVRQLAFVKAA
ncbi:LPS assembly lipoprotein LptE [Xenophilus arseniciresistens]|uniref:LPS-assembly lipoprotein LptE n=1 Tax=Xenophilus arseniciresistens TaxID=1283306 RepID=A0AAE3T2Q3_9BURK|nr:LPS assembly lipoprotein LptE [Xenophilus arseniciresistens]MDA7418657.1 LPS assembly lipoprotein LptE [Xenophilus arseniciresistens]